MTEREGNLPPPDTTQALRRTWPAIGLAAMAALATSVSLSRPLSFDEMYWLTMARRIFSVGDLPYFDLLDNKGPLLYTVVGLADLIPVNARGVFTVLYVTVVMSLAVGSYRLALSSGQRPVWAVYTAAMVSVGTSALSVWAVTSELLTAAVVVWAFVAGRPWLRVALVLASCLIDPRAVLLAPIVLIHGTRGRGVTGRHLVAFVCVAVSALATVVVVPELRYAFVEASLATRFDTNAVDVALVTAAALTPLFVVASLRLSRIPAAAVATLLVALVIGFSASVPFGHYWVYLLLILPLLPILRPRFSLLSTGVLTAGALLVLTLSTRDHFRHDVDAASIADPISQEIEHIVRPDDRVLIWASSPHLRFRIAEQTLGFAPTSNYFAWDLPSPELLLERLEENLAEATVLVVHPGLEDYRGFPVVAAALSLVADRAADSECSVDVSEVVVFRYTGC